MWIEFLNYFLECMVIIVECGLIKGFKDWKGFVIIFYYFISIYFIKRIYLYFYCVRLLKYSIFYSYYVNLIIYDNI